MKALRRIKRDFETSTEELQDNLTHHKRFLTDQIARDIEDLRISPQNEAPWIQQLRRPNSFQNPTTPTVLEPLLIDDDSPNKRAKSKKGKRVRFDMNGEIIEPTEAVQPDALEPVSSSRRARRCWSDTGFDDASLLDQTSTEMEKLALSSHHKRAKSEKDAMQSWEEPALPSMAVEIPDMEDISMDSAAKEMDDGDMSEEDSMVIRVRDPYRALILRQPVDSPLQRLLRRELEQNSMALVVYEDPKKNLTLGPLLTLLEDQRAKLSAASLPDVEMQDSPPETHTSLSSSEMEL
eukprot:TRINITY_DN12742_c0_g1_i1.p1 TRINITY_DN12742_c0_g1~~TRINITY_DN12742_c0_g1_i1.p1  ORF type:complete len:293 (+),score=51.76 TRINITY_DN12742_c0_g1_i1:81-959(+)